MAKSRLATEFERQHVARGALDAIASGRLDDVPGELRPTDELAFPFPADVLIELGADALALARATRSEPIALDDFADRYLGEFEVRGNTARQKLAAAQHLVVATHDGVVLDYFGTAGWWQQQDLWSYAFLVLVGMVRVVSERTGRPVEQVCAELVPQDEHSG